MKKFSEWREWSDKDDVWAQVHNMGAKIKPDIKKAIGRHLPEQTGEPNFVEDQNRAVIAQILLDLAKEYDPR